MAATGLIPFLLIAITGPYAFQLVFGNEWRSAGIYAQVLSIWIFLQYINRPAVSAIPSLKIQRQILLYEIFSTGTKIIALWAGFEIYHNTFIAVTLFSLSGSVAYIWLILWIIKKSGTNKKLFPKNQDETQKTGK
jgi:O-antigen/teichoic acid export membrane protein